MKKLLVLTLSMWSLAVNAQNIDRYFDGIRNNTAALTAFFSQMPKGGDLHNHYSGSVYAETYIDYVVDRNYYINITTLAVDSIKPKSDPLDEWFKFSQLKANNTLNEYKQKLIQKWSCKDYNGVSYPSDLQFFETFSGFGIGNNNNSRLEVGLLELKRRAQKENVSYIETMFTGFPCPALKTIDGNFNDQLLTAQQTHDEAQVKKLLDQLFQLVQDKGVVSCAKTFNDEVLAPMHKRLKIDDSSFTMRYQNYVTRVVPPADLFKNLVLYFESADRSPLIVGVNIVAPENNDVSMRDYWLHMQMFRYMHSKYPNVKYAMHAGELALGMVKPEEMTWHINEAVRVAGANRIGHGVDIPYEYKSFDLLKYMAKNKTAIEINLYSNEFILKVKEDEHPFNLYKEYNVPIVICTDDAGVLRSNLTRQYVLLAKRYKNVSYEDIKQYVYNSIDYSFIEEESLKAKLKADLDTRFRKFEKTISAQQQ